MPHVMGPALSLGLPGIILILWWYGDKARERDMRVYREDTRNILQAYQADMQAIRQMYENNVVLCKQYADLASNLKDLIVLNTQGYQKLVDDINKNQFCPYVRLKKEAEGVQG